MIAVKGSVAAEALELAENEKLAGKVFIDTTNPIAEAPYGVVAGGVPVGPFVKAINSIGNTKMVLPEYESRQPSMSIRGNNEGRERR